MANNHVRQIKFSTISPEKIVFKLSKNNKTSDSYSLRSYYTTTESSYRTYIRDYSLPSDHYEFRKSSST